MAKSYLLSRSGDGFNRVIDGFDIEVLDQCRAQQIKPINEFLRKFASSPHQLALEIGQVLKVSWEDIARVIDRDGYIDAFAQEELDEYFECRLSIRQVHFLQRQCGDVGQNNRH